jgi:hypothetical protein
MLSGFRQQPDVAHLVLPEHVVGKGPVAVEVPRANTHAEVMPEAECVLVLDAAIGQIPARWRTDVLVTIDGAGASHEVIEHLSGLNTAPAHGKRGRRVEYSIGWPVDERTQGGLGQVRERDWTVALDADPDPNAGVVDPALRACGARRLAFSPGSKSFGKA